MSATTAGRRLERILLIAEVSLYLQYTSARIDTRIQEGKIEPKVAAIAPGSPGQPIRCSGRSAPRGYPKRVSRRPAVRRPSLREKHWECRPGLRPPQPPTAAHPQGQHEHDKSRADSGVIDRQQFGGHCRRVGSERPALENQPDNLFGKRYNKEHDRHPDLLYARNRISNWALSTRKNIVSG